MEAVSPEGIHYGFFMPWVQQLGWRCWHQPWFLGDELEGLIKYYGNLRSSLFPYIYSMAYKAAAQSLPIARALSLMYQDKPEYDSVTNCYMFGDSFIVGVFDMNITLPEGKWYDYFTGEIYDGGRVVNYKIPEGRGGALFVKCGSIVPTMAPCPYVEKFKGDKYTLDLYHGEDAQFTLYEDDGLTYDYLDGAYATTDMSLTSCTDGEMTFKVEKRAGTYEGRAKREGDAYRLSDPVITGISGTPSFDVVLHTAEAKDVMLDGQAVEFKTENGKTYFTIPSELHDTKDLVYKIKI